METEESAINNEAIKEHKFAMSAVNTETYDLLKRIKPYIETIKICELKCNRFTDADKTAKGILEEVIKINKQHIVQILEL